MQLMRRYLALLGLCSVAFVPAASAQTLDPKLYSEMHWRQIGPTRAGRARALSGVPGQPNVFYIGFDNGGVWRSTDFGSTWIPLFDNQPTSSIGAIAVAPSDPNIIYVGTGAGIIRPDLATGDGVYKSTNAGKTWTHLGLRDTQMIANIEVDPHNPNRLFVAALGHPYGPNSERGIFRSTDGGATFEKVLYKDEYTSGNDVRIDPAQPNTIYAALWQQQQGFFENGAFGGTDGGIFKSTDGGSTWKQLAGGLPPIIQANLAIAPSNPKILYAMVAADVPNPPAPAGAAGRAPRGGRGGNISFYKTTDGGEHWGLATDDPASLKLAQPAVIHRTTGPWAASAAAIFPPSRSTRRTKKSSTVAPPFSGAPRTLVSPGPLCVALPAVTIIKRAGSIRTIPISFWWSAIRAEWFPPIAASRGATGITSPPPPCITSPPTTHFRTACAEASRIPALHV